MFLGIQPVYKPICDYVLFWLRSEKKWSLDTLSAINYHREILPGRDFMKRHHGFLIQSPHKSNKYISDSVFCLLSSNSSSCYQKWPKLFSDLIRRQIKMKHTKCSLLLNKQYQCLCLFLNWSLTNLTTSFSFRYIRVNVTHNATPPTQMCRKLNHIPWLQQNILSDILVTNKDKTRPPITYMEGHMFCNGLYWLSL